MSTVTAMSAQVLWVEHQAFAQHTLLAGQNPPWQEPVALASWLSKAQGLLNQLPVIVSLEEGLRAWISQESALIQDLRATKGVLGPVKALCAHPGFTTWLSQLCAALHTQLPRGRWALQVPCPAWWLRHLNDLARDSSGAHIDPDDAEDGAVYIANALRAISPDTLEVLIIDTRLPGQQDMSAGADTLQKFSSHYQWSFGLRAHQRLTAAPKGMDFEVLDALEQESCAHDHRIGLSTTLACAWAALPTKSASNHDFIVVELPTQQAPEDVLPALRALATNH